MKTTWNRRDFLKTASAATLSALAAVILGLRPNSPTASGSA